MPTDSFHRGALFLLSLTRQAKNTQLINVTKVSDGQAPGGNGICWASNMTICYQGQTVIMMQAAGSESACFGEPYIAGQIAANGLSSGLYSVQVWPSDEEWAITTFQLDYEFAGGVIMQVCGSRFGQSAQLGLSSWRYQENACNNADFTVGDLFGGYHTWTMICKFLRAKLVLFDTSNEWTVFLMCQDSSPTTGTGFAGFQSMVTTSSVGTTTITAFLTAVNWLWTFTWLHLPLVIVECQRLRNQEEQPPICKIDNTRYRLTPFVLTRLIIP